METWGDLKAFFEHGAKKSVGEHTQAAKKLFHPIDDPSLIKETTISGLMAEIRKNLLRLGMSDGAFHKFKADSSPDMDSYAYNGKLVENQTAAELKVSLKLAINAMMKAETQAANVSIPCSFSLGCTQLYCVGSSAPPVRWR
jgi:hypothetical protein